MGDMNWRYELSIRMGGEKYFDRQRVLNQVPKDSFKDAFTDTFNDALNDP